MNWRIQLLISVLLTAVITILLYQSLSITIYRITEPRFNCPVKIEWSRLTIRNDALGDGDFGAKRRNGRSHSGIDIQVPTGTPVYASKSGMAFCSNVPTGYGRYVMIYHPDGFQTFYGHLANWAIPPIKKVRKGELIGFAGKTGNASSKLVQPHLHFEIRKNGEPQDPVQLMR